jgi:hypothetical protein
MGDLSLVAREPSNNATPCSFDAIFTPMGPVALKEGVFVVFLQCKRITFSHLLPEFPKSQQKRCVGWSN